MLMTENVDMMCRRVVNNYGGRSNVLLPLRPCEESGALGAWWSHPPRTTAMKMNGGNCQRVASAVWFTSGLTFVPAPLSTAGRVCPATPLRRGVCVGPRRPGAAPHSPFAHRYVIVHTTVSELAARCPWRIGVPEGVW